MRSSEQILTDLLTTGNSVAPYLNFIPKTPQGDLLAITTTEFSRAYAVADYIKDLSRLSGYVDLDTNTTLRSQLMTALNLTEDELNALLISDLDNFSAMWNITRNQALPATGMIEVHLTSSTPVTILSNTRFKNLVTGNYYTSLDDVTAYTPTIPTNGSDYVVRVMVECELDGVDGNVIAGSSFIPVIDIANFTQATNPSAFDDGVDTESNTDFVSRIMTLRISSGVGSKSYVTSLMLSDARVFSVWLNAKGEQYFSRPWGVDVWIQGVETIKTVDASGSIAPLLFVPFVSAESFAVNSDTGWYARSAFEVVTPTVAAGVYTYDQTIRDLQMMVEDADNWLIGGQTLCIVKKGYKIPINMFVKIYFVYGLTNDEKATVVTNIQENLLLFYTGGDSSYGTSFIRKLLGVDIDKSDLLNVVLNTDGVDRAELTGTNAFSAVRSDGEYPTSDPIPILPYEYASLGTMTIIQG